MPASPSGLAKGGRIHRAEGGAAQALAPYLSGGTASRADTAPAQSVPTGRAKDRKSTRLNSSHSQISYAVFCLKKKKSHELDYAERGFTFRPGAPLDMRMARGRGLTAADFVNTWPV